MNLCTESNCGQAAVGRGLCARHYQQQRRAGSLTPGPSGGRPPAYSEEVRRRWGGAPRLGLRLEPELYDWVQEQGGSAWVHQLLQHSFEAPLPTSAAPRAWTVRQAAQFLRTLHQAYRWHCGQSSGPMVRLLDLYDVLTRLPEARQAYPVETFTVHVHQLDRHGAAAAALTGLPHRLFPGATAARRRSNLLVFQPEGRTRELTYYGVEFLPTPI
jgi:hypothetical protein